MDTNTGILDAAVVENRLRLDLLLVARFKDANHKFEIPLPPGKTFQAAIDAGLIQLTGWEPYDVRLVTMTDEGIARRNKLLTADAQQTRPPIVIELDDRQTTKLLKRQKEMLSEALSLLRSMAPKPVSWNEISG